MFRRIKSSFRGHGPWVLASAVVLALCASPFAIAASSGTSILAGKRNPTNISTALTSETQIIAKNATYGTRQSNLSANGGGAIYGCRTAAGGSAAKFNPCIRANNLSTGSAFEFAANGPTVGTFTNQNAAGAPFSTNATGVVTNLNADKVDGKDADTLASDALSAAKGLTPVASVSATGTLGANRGVTAATRTGTGTYTVAFAADISACVIQATETDYVNAGAVGVQLGDDKKTVTVRTRDGGGADGTGATAVADHPFNLTVSC
jgi:hypothetical protein